MKLFKWVSCLYDKGYNKKVLLSQFIKEKGLFTTEKKHFGNIFKINQQK